MTDHDRQMKSYLIESLAPLVFRSGKPFESQASAQDVIFPLPSAGAGLVRYLSLSQTNNNDVLNLSKEKFNDPSYQATLSIQSQGPFLVRYSDESDIEILVPKPANALYFEDKQTGEKQLVRLEPKAFEQEGELCGSDLPQGLLHVQMKKELKDKPAKGAAFWTLKDFIAWQKGDELDFKQVDDHGLVSIPIELRTHVAIDDESLASADGMLFQTASYDLAHQKSQSGWSDKRLGFLVQTQENLKQDLASFGGERRLSHFKQVEPKHNISASYEITQDDVNQINEAKGFSLSFVTPCIFGQGALPAWIDKTTLMGELPETNIKVALKAMAIDRWQAVSGWDSLLWKPKATRKAISAGSVYWFEITEGQFDVQSLQQLCTHVWSDHKQDKNDGFGSAILAAWKHSN